MGVDLGQASDPAAWVLNERQMFGIRKLDEVTTYSEMHATAYGRFPLRTPYTEMARKFATIAQTPDLFHEILFIVDCTRERAMYDIMRETQALRTIPIIPIVLTGGAKHSKQDEYGWYTVPEGELLSDLMVAMESQRQVLSRDGGEKEGDAEALDEQLKKIRQRVSRRGSVGMTVDGTDVEHDDLAFALAYTTWYSRVSGLFQGLPAKVNDGAEVQMDSKFPKTRSAR